MRREIDAYQRRVSWGIAASASLSQRANRNIDEIRDDPFFIITAGIGVPIADGRARHPCPCPSRWRRHHLSEERSDWAALGLK